MNRELAQYRACEQAADSHTCSHAALFTVHMALLYQTAWHNMAKNATLG